MLAKNASMPVSGQGDRYEKHQTVPVWHGCHHRIIYDDGRSQGCWIK
jgi:hypothetical protein